MTCDCGCNPDGFSPEAIEAIFDDDYQPTMIPKAALLEIREHLTTWMTKPSIYRNLTRIEDVSSEPPPVA